MLIPNFPRQMAWQREREKLLFLHQIMTSKDNKTSHSKSLKNMTHVLMVPPFTVSPHLPCIISFPQEARWMGGLLYYIFTSYYIFTFKIKSTKSKNYITSKRTINISQCSDLVLLGSYPRPSFPISSKMWENDTKYTKTNHKYPDLNISEYIWLHSWAIFSSLISPPLLHQGGGGPSPPQPRFSQSGQK